MIVLRNLRYRLPWFALLSLLPLALTACNNGTAPQLPEVVINRGCGQPNFPADQPDLFAQAPPRFVTDTGEETLLIRPGEDLLAEIPVNAATSQIFAELSNAWAPDEVIFTQTLSTPGNEVVPAIFLTNPRIRGRYYLRLTLCGSDCDDREVVFDLIEPDPDDPTTGINADYVRTVMDGREVIQEDQTCVKPNSVVIQ